MADQCEWKTTSRPMESEGKGNGHQYGRKPRTPEPIGVPIFVHPATFVQHLCILMHKCLNNCAPRYLAESIRQLSDDPNKSRLRSSKSADVTIPRTKTKMGDRAFRIAGPRVWNNIT